MPQSSLDDSASACEGRQRDESFSLGVIDRGVSVYFLFGLKKEMRRGIMFWGEGRKVKREREME